MFVRWQTTVAAGEFHRLRAVLVESKRIDGKPRQLHIAFLGSLDYARRGEIEERWYFWTSALQRLDRLDNRLSAEQRGAIEKALAERVRPLTPAQIETCKKREEERERRTQEEIREIFEQARPFLLMSRIAGGRANRRPRQKP
jgi:hypothetical protein